MTVITAEARITARDLTGDAFASVSKKLANLGKSTKFTADVKKLSDSLKHAGDQLKAIESFKGAQSGFVAARQRFRETQAAVEATARAMAAAEKPTRALEAAHRQAQAAVTGAAAAYERKRDAIIGAKRAVESFGSPVTRIVASERAARSAIDQTSAAMERRMRVEERRVARREAAGTLAAGAGVIAASKGFEIGKKAVVSAAEFDIAVRKQKEFSDLTEDDQKGLVGQAKKIGQETPFTNLDVVKAQTKAMQGLPSSFNSTLRAQVAQGILENVKNYALVLESDLAHSAEAVRSYLQATGKDISTKEKALTESNKATNQLVKMAKLGGMSDEDVQQFMKFAAAPGTAGGFSTDSLMALAALARRGGLRGDEAGVSIRSMASKLNSPTKAGIAALNAAGLKFSDYVRMPDQLDVGRLEGQFQNDLGKSFTPAVRAKLAGILGNKDLVADRGRFTEAVTEAVAELFPVTKKGTMAAADRQKIAKSAGSFHKVSGASVDVERLLDDAMKSSMTLPQLNALLTDKHGGKAAITQRQWDEYKAARAEIAKSGEDPDYAKKKADYIYGGLGGSLENMKGSYENLLLSVGQANAELAKLSFDKLGSAMDAVANLSPPALQAATALTALAAAAVAYKSAMFLGDKAGKLLGLGTAAAGAAGGVVGGSVAGGAAAGAAGATAAATGRMAAIRALGARAAGAVGGSVAGPLGLAFGMVPLLEAGAEQFGTRPALGPGGSGFGRAVRRSLDETYGPAPSSGAGGPSTVQANVTGTVTGEAAIRVTVDASSSLVQAAQAATQAAAKLAGSLSSGGSTSMPQYASPPK